MWGRIASCPRVCNPRLTPTFDLLKTEEGPVGLTGTAGYNALESSLTDQVWRDAKLLV